MEERETGNAEEIEGGGGGGGGGEEVCEDT